MQLDKKLLLDFKNDSKVYNSDVQEFVKGLYNEPVILVTGSCNYETDKGNFYYVLTFNSFTVHDSLQDIDTTK